MQGFAAEVMVQYGSLDFCSVLRYNMCVYLSEDI